MSLASQIAAVAYVIVLLGCLKAAHAARLYNRGARHMRGWLFIAIFTLVLLLARLVDAEDLMRESLREVANSVGRYESRRIWQPPLALLVFLSLGAVGVLARRLWLGGPPSVTGRRLRIAQAATALFAPLYALRILSLHAIDAFLYFGPLHPNWLLEAGLLLTILYNTLRYASDCRERPAHPMPDKRSSKRRAN